MDLFERMMGVRGEELYWFSSGKREEAREEKDKKKEAASN